MGANYWAAELTTWSAEFQNPDLNLPPSDPRTLTVPY